MNQETIGDGDRLFDEGSTLRCALCGGASAGLVRSGGPHSGTRYCNRARCVSFAYSAPEIDAEITRRLSLAAKAQAEKWEPRKDEKCEGLNVASGERVVGEFSHFGTSADACKGPTPPVPTAVLTTPEGYWTHVRRESLRPLQSPPPPVALYIPKHGETVRVVEVSPKDPTPKLKVGDVLTLNGDAHATPSCPGFLWLDGTYCRVEKVEASTDDGSGYRCPLCFKSGASGKRCGCGDMLRAAEKRIVEQVAQEIRAGGSSKPDPYAKVRENEDTFAAGQAAQDAVRRMQPRWRTDNEHDRRVAAHRRHLEQAKAELGRKVEARHPSDWDVSEGSESELRVTS